MTAPIDSTNFLQLVPVEKELRHEWWSSVLRNSIASQIRAMRESRGWTQAELAKRMDVTPSFVSQLESPSKRNPPSIRTLRRVAEVFDVALLVRFERWGKAVAIVAGGVVPLPYTEESGGSCVQY